MVGQVLFWLVISVLLGRAYVKCREGRVTHVVCSTIAVAVYVFSLYVPLNLQVAELTTSKIAKAGVLRAPVASEVSSYCFFWGVELVLFGAGEALAVWLASELPRQEESRLLSSQRGAVEGVIARDKISALILLSVGVISYLAFSASTSVDRAEGGQGLQVFLRNFMLSGLILVVYSRGFRSKWWYAAVVAGCGVLVASNVRSPLLILLLSGVAVLIACGAFRSRITMTVVISSGLIFAAVASLMSALRANEARNYGMSFFEVVSQTFADPWIAPYTSGLDNVRRVQVIFPYSSAGPSRTE